MGVKVFDYNTGSSQPIALCLGFFDCLHLGHVRLLDRAKDIAAETGIEAGIFTFDPSPATVMNADFEGEIFTLEERLYRMDELGVHIAIVAHTDEKLLATSPEKFLDNLTNSFNVKAIVCGSDYTYGAMGAGDISSLKSYCEKKEIKLYTMNLLTDLYGEKIASRKIRQYLKIGDICLVNSCLPLPYIIRGEVVRGRCDGHKMGFPTANINLNKDKLKPANGVYYTNVVLYKRRYPCITNVGTHPTFSDYSENVETHIIGFDGDLYGKTITVEFMDKIRDIYKFNSKEEIAAQLTKDVGYALRKFEDDKIRPQRNK